MRGSDAPAWAKVLFAVGILAGLLNIAILTLLAVSPVPLQENPRYVAYVLAVLATLGVSGFLFWISKIRSAAVVAALNLLGVARIIFVIVSLIIKV